VRLASYASRVRLSRAVLQLGFVATLVLIAACSSSSSDDGVTTDDDAGSTDDDGGSTTGDDSGTTTTKDGGTSTTDSGSAPVDSGPSTDIPPITSPDGFGAARTACINEINRLRATQGHAVYALWTGTTIDTCVDQQATSDEAADSPHQAWMKKPAAVCDGNAQDECEGQGVTAAGVVECLDSMWNEQNQPNCTGCSACTAAFFDPSDPAACPNCDYFGAHGGECGHYVNMSADWLAKVDCGFATGAGDTWSTQNFSQ
jgi:hypothetical protein